MDGFAEPSPAEDVPQIAESGHAVGVIYDPRLGTEDFVPPLTHGSFKWRI
jgi:hypothetical protein